MRSAALAAVAAVLWLYKKNDIFVLFCTYYVFCCQTLGSGGVRTLSYSVQKNPERCLLFTDATVVNVVQTLSTTAPLTAVSQKLPLPNSNSGVRALSPLVSALNGFSVNPYVPLSGCRHMVHRYTRTPLYNIRSGVVRG